MNDQHPPLEQAPEPVQLAVDLIYLLESNAIDPAIALEAIQMVEADLKNKLNAATEV
ncbi:pleiotropic regulatory protein RsmS [Vibrio gazogenes]|uniref:Primosomal protein n=1 Tax=Vibrio gazogenes DSM 21264 = NBRC 103151 TaxID=1123492 RepID=A0A1M5DWN7_VIBGA|nr:pleiotropic regulatory protein RsmS [Vibrio gazogenes]USP14897.1 pleiotropic regulatory protein RsmS [Vibrio gazogenes]SHF71355.1 Protein of unknown function [Vibrio gazogenes DSM 21264] [Vibrio gazogenes DSM 21264 = NBRC 103151]